MGFQSNPRPIRGAEVVSGRLNYISAKFQPSSAINRVNAVIDPHNIIIVCLSVPATENLRCLTFTLGTLES